MTRMLALLGLVAAMILAAAPAGSARTAVTPYIEVQQVLTADLNGGEVLTYTALAAGVDAHASTRRVEAQISYRYERRVSWNEDLADDSIHSGVARMRAELVPGRLVLNAGALATRSRAGAGAPILGFGVVDNASLADVYGVYAGPDFSSRLGPVNVAASYRLGYVKVADAGFTAFAPPAGVQDLDRYDSSWTQSVTASIGMRPGALPFGWTLGAGYGREDANRLDRRYEAAYVRGDIVLPASYSVALTAGAGYEDVQSSQRDIKRNSGGVPIVAPGGALVPDPSRPRLLAYDAGGFVWDVGVIWRPSRRTELQARAGRRYGDWTVTGSFRHRLNGGYAVSAVVYDTIDSFGRSVVAGLGEVPVDFRVGRNPLNPGIGGIGGCLFGGDPGSGVCLDNAFQAISAANYRSRGANILFSGERGPWSFGIGAGYSNRRYYTVQPLAGFVLDPVTDQSFNLSANVSRALGRDAGIGFDAYAGWYDSGQAGFDAAVGAGVSGSYYRSLIYDRLRAQAAIGLYTTDSGAFGGTAASALVGLRYTF